MKLAILIIALFYNLPLVSANETIVPPSPSIAELSDKAKRADIVTLCHPNKERTALEITSILKGEKIYQSKKDIIIKMTPKGDAKALTTERYAEIVFFRMASNKNGTHSSNSYALWPEKVEILGKKKFRFLAHDIDELRHAISTAE